MSCMFFSIVDLNTLLSPVFMSSSNSNHLTSNFSIVDRCKFFDSRNAEARSNADGTVVSNGISTMNIRYVFPFCVAPSTNNDDVTRRRSISRVVMTIPSVSSLNSRAAVAMIDPRSSRLSHFPPKSDAPIPRTSSPTRK